VLLADGAAVCVAAAGWVEFCVLLALFLLQPETISAADSTKLLANAKETLFFIGLVRCGPESRSCAFLKILLTHSKITFPGEAQPAERTEPYNTAQALWRATASRAGEFLPASKPKRYPAFLAICMLLLLLALSMLNAFNLHFLRPQSAGEIYLFTAISIVSFLLLVTLIVLLARNILKLLADQQSRVLGSRLRSRMILGALILSFAPALFMFLFSYLLMNRSIDRWFSQPSTDLREASSSIALEMANYMATNARAEAESLAGSSAFAALQSGPAAPTTGALHAAQAAAMAQAMKRHRVTLQGGFVAVFEDAQLRTGYQLPARAQTATVHPWLEDSAPDHREHVVAAPALPLSQAILQAAQSSDALILNAAGTHYAVGAASLNNGGLIVVGLPVPAGLPPDLDTLRAGARQYWAIYRQRRTIRRMYLLLLLMLTALVFFSSSWLALYLSKQITRPVEALADAMSEISQGHYYQRVTVNASQELGELVRSFNEMASDLEQSRLLADYYTQQLSTANQTLETRRNELETILETIPSAVLTLDAGRRVLGCNRAFAALFPAADGGCREGTLLADVVPAEVRDDVLDLDRRARRMGLASTEIELRREGNIINLVLTLAAVSLGGHQRGAILVIENVTELLRAQRQVAWKEVAQRVAHEIKNPLTPVTLSAERIRRHTERNTPESQEVIRRCCDIILSAAESVRRLVDQFGVLAEFPAAMPLAADLNSIAESAVLQFEDRLDGIRIEQHFTDPLPAVMADAEALKRALANLIDNAAEAMHNSLLRVLSIETCLSEAAGMAEIVIADTGSGLTEEMRERLFLPYFSTKQRGTGLGLTIAAKIVQDHGGTIRAEQNAPKGTRFVINLPLADAMPQPVTLPHAGEMHQA
jgi:nitrogen fixation/metabolism regulation signal transduction histidine kinase